mmetsp:Transcript_42951/g.124177  ORF Transcript_42951/g.124177 Transcript_42951/m.124177 type:complete len:217 (-) Transcript_42951:274-924(-)
MELRCRLHQPNRLHGLRGGQVEPLEGRHQCQQLHQLPARDLEWRTRCVTAFRLPAVPGGNLEQRPRCQRVQHVPGLWHRHVPACARSSQRQRLPRMRTRQLQRLHGRAGVRELPGWLLEFFFQVDGVQCLPRGLLDPPQRLSAPGRLHSLVVEPFLREGDCEDVEVGLLDLGGRRKDEPQHGLCQEHRRGLRGAGERGDGRSGRRVSLLIDCPRHL